MPELPEVETLCRQLQAKVAGKIITATEVYDDKLAGLKDICGRKVIAVRREGKTIVITLDNGFFILIHLRMTGRLFWQKADGMIRHSRFRLGFGDGNILLVDPRRFATIKIVRQIAPGKQDLFTAFNLEDFILHHGRRKTNVKNVLMDQKAIAGIGNIYACETLYSAGISPEMVAATMKMVQWKKVFHHAKAIMKKAIQKRGTSVSDWRDLYGCQGENQHELKVYGRAGEKCFHCREKIERIKQGGRSTFYCPQCQKSRV
jgi:formamidopyrimidine-DNA glycosylase